MKQLYPFYQLIFLTCILLTSCQPDNTDQEILIHEESTNAPLVAFIQHSSSKENMVSGNHFSKTLTYAKYLTNF
ncbi:hypothetical protein RBU60_12625 [Mesonia sp. MT50]|uniref:Uncharacterized protein n=1 Tax=Mesonia profundi TaxID=3070998 RepID=A0ABU1A416_9FLAO|nr:hypothetical protein [Mesonia profundi]MDQ7918417.1 hypothetical protein [Mesonia profundi]